MRGVEIKTNTYIPKKRMLTVVDLSNHMLVIVKTMVLLCCIPVHHLCLFLLKNSLTFWDIRLYACLPRVRRFKTNQQQVFNYLLMPGCGNM